MDEIVDIFDDNFHQIGTALKSKVHREGIWHQTFHCWIVRKREGRAYILFQKRAMQKEDSPGLLDISAAGHLIAGEKKEQGVREITEELGILPSVDNMCYLGVRIATYYFRHIRNKEFCHVYLLENNTPLEQFQLRGEEVYGLAEVEITQGLKLFSNQVDHIECVFFYGEHSRKEMITIGVKDFLPRIDPYYLRICSVADQFFSGYPYICI